MSFFFLELFYFFQSFFGGCCLWGWCFCFFFYYCWSSFVVCNIVFIQITYIFFLCCFVFFFFAFFSSTTKHKRYAPEFVYVGLANPPVGSTKNSTIYDFRWDVKVEHLASGNSIPAGIGVAIQDVDLSMDPEHQEGAYVYLCTGEKMDGDIPEDEPEEYADEWWWDDVIGVEVNREVGYVRFYKNGVDQGIAFYKDWDEDVKIHLYVAMAGEGDKMSIVHDPSASGASEKDELFEGKLLCDNITLAEQGAAPIDVFFECMSCQVTICRACAYQCHNGHSVNLQISFGNLRCVCLRSKCEDHECLSLPDLGDEEKLAEIKGGAKRTRRAKKRDRRVQKYWSIAPPSKHTFKALLESVPPAPAEDTKASGKKNFAGF